MAAVLIILTLLSSAVYSNAQVGIGDAIQARKKAFDWILSKWREPQAGLNPTKTGGWDQTNTARVITSLQLIDDKWAFKNDKMSTVAIQHLNAEILAALVRSDNMTTLLPEEGSEFINALLATCQNPRDFFGFNLVNMLRARLDTIPSGSNTKNVGQVIAAVTALCNVGVSIPISALQRINSEVKPGPGSCPYCVETSSLAILAVKCVRDREGKADDALIKGIMTRQTAYVKGKQDKNGGFGNLVATALAVQAANAVGTVNLPVNVATALNYLLADQDAEGSFGNVPLTALVNPTLIGRSALDIKDIPCPASRPLDNPAPAGKNRVILVVHDTIYAKRTIDSNLDVSIGNNLLRILNDESAKHPRAFQFTTTITSGVVQLTAVNSVANDAKNNWIWQVTRKPGSSTLSSIVSASLDRFVPLDGETVTLRFGPPL